MRRAAAFIDKDGTLVRDVPYNVDPKRVELTPGAATALRELRHAGYALIVVSNQPGIAERRFEVDALHGVMNHMRELLSAQGVSLDGIYWCPHAAQAVPSCGCRKPAPGLLLRAAEALDIDLEASWMLGDILDDVEAGRRAGCRGILVDCGNETEWVMTPWRVPAAVVPTLPAAAQFIHDVARDALPPESAG